jgi:hypothetical protein
VEAVAPHPVLLVQRLRDGVAVGGARHGLVEGGVEDRHRGNPGEELAGHLNAVQVGRVMQGRERDHVPDRLGNAIVHAGRCVEALAPVDHAVADGGQLAQVRQDPAPAQPGDDPVDPVPMVEDREALLATLGATVRAQPLPLDLALGLADAGNRAGGQHAPTHARKEPELDGGASGVQDQDLHAATASFSRSDSQSIARTISRGVSRTSDP